MCFNVASNKSKKELEKKFKAVFEDAVYDPYYSVSGFVHPRLPVIASDQPHTIQLNRWGLIPFWVKSEEQAKELSTQTLNARAESIFEKPSFRHSAGKKKCCVLVNGFYEWHTEGKTKTPFFIYRKDHEPFALGGLWDEWANPETGEIIRTFTILTVPASPMLAEIHNSKLRMPLILDHGREQEWLETADKTHTAAMCRPFHDELLQAHQISRLINGRHGNPNVPEVQEPVNGNGQQSSLF
ncbi:MAG: SOS response-associated peptidase [Bacteroidia bacterium]